MTCVVHDFTAEIGGGFRVSLTYDAPTESGKSTPQTDTYEGYFARLVPGQEIVEVIEFETDDPQLEGKMTMRTSVDEAGGETTVVIDHEGLPPGVSPAQNEVGTRMALDNLARLVEQPQP